MVHHSPQNYKYPTLLGPYKVPAQAMVNQVGMRAVRQAMVPEAARFDIEGLSTNELN